VISAVLIVRNEAANLRACLESIRAHVEEIIVVDTGSTDETVAIAESIADRVEHFEWVDDFSAARNFAWKLASHPWVLWLDGDDILENGERLQAITQHWDEHRQNHPIIITMEYAYAHDDAGNCITRQTRERLACPGPKFEWRDPVHECLHPTAPDTIIHKEDRVRVVHRSKPRENSNRNLTILRKWYDGSDGSNSRMLYYLAREYMTVGDHGQALSLFTKYIGRSTWEDERFFACVEISKIYEKWHDYDSALRFAWLALQSRESWFDAYFAIGRCYYWLAQRGGPEERRHWERARHWLEVGLSMPPMETLLPANPVERAHDVHLFLNVVRSKLGDLPGARDSCRDGLETKETESLRSNLASYEATLARRRLEQDLGQLNLEPSQSRAILELLDAPPKAPQLPPGKFDIIVFTGPALERWTPATVAQTGIGGSETMALELSKRWAADGHRVRLYGDCAGQEGFYDGVEYLDSPRFPGASCDVLVASRRPDAVDDGVCDAKLRFVWVHDVHLGDKVTHARALRTDRYLALSQWHKGYLLTMYPQIHSDQIIVTRNGIDLKRFEAAPKRDPHKAIYASSPDRGLLSLLQMWPHIREKVSDATLHCFYGFENWKRCGGQAMAHPSNTPAEIKRLLAKLETSGVYFHGRVSQERLAIEMLSAGVWLYPTWFHETSCISAMEAQAAGLWLVTSPIAALNETAWPFARMINGDWLSKGYQEDFIKGAIGAMESPAHHKNTGDRFNLDSLAKDWIAMFQTTEPDMMPPYRGYK
jgi:glycosyltransferase involved in cell wall biosynthesis